MSIEPVGSVTSSQGADNSTLNAQLRRDEHKLAADLKAEAAAAQLAADHMAVAREQQAIAQADKTHTIAYL